MYFTFIIYTKIINIYMEKPQEFEQLQAKNNEVKIYFIRHT